MIWLAIIFVPLVLWWSWWTLPIEEGRMQWEREQRENPLKYNGLCGPL